ncbi:putative (S)-N-methylcoclaurine 3'-hydroxylase isozyme 2 [Cocos nucifera]|uniref:Putative (S)-N-methylcoclaurine 3'-hydroxylase isozyme 2 n=1 Tax=Cocos nucifera TaxID=13894 RepID=A0A8K0ILY1_COCNU|nr:putative (S)-N-methylcoclaurine 3'-hydroxylase isozyme 2 [Cocos nucifera]
MHTKGFTEYSMVWSLEPGVYWKNARRILQLEVLTPKLVEAQAHIRELKVTEMVDSLRERQGEVVRLRDAVRRTLFGVLVRLMFSSEVARNEMEDLLCTDTTTTTIEWAMAELIKNKPILENLRSELEREIGEDRVRESLLPHLHYLHACIKETQRLHPAVPLLVHEALQTCETMAYTIPKGCHVLVNVWAIGRDPETWEDPLTFFDGMQRK